MWTWLLSCFQIIKWHSFWKSKFFLEIMSFLKIISKWRIIALHWCRKWQPIPVFLPGKIQNHGQRSLAGFSPWSCKESDTMEWLSMQNYFRMLRWFLPHNKVNQPYVCICPLPPEPPSHSLPQKANFNHDTRDDHLYTLVCVCVHLSGG